MGIRRQSVAITCFSCDYAYTFYRFGGSDIGVLKDMFELGFLGQLIFLAL